MSRIGKKPVPVPAGVKVEVAGQTVTVSGRRGSLQQTLPAPITASVQAGHVAVARADDSRQSRALHGLCRAMIRNMVVGVTDGFKKQLEVRGTGYKAQVAAGQLAVSVGFTNPVQVPIPKGITVNVENNTIITIEGADRQAVGQLAASVRAIKPPDAYKGKGVRYVGEYVIQKEGKSVA